ncbi:MAG: alpha-L-fucosidase [Flavobacteriaceae bacterium]|jgi:alpha-L-fucosidase|nr:alpha-L-fucosidase [Flavobacteriaceae bacterium]|tara:strand:+ start:3645 stop:4973 length:1329 start_codon:yes stop_codon:yes gene_type:complete
MRHLLFTFLISFISYSQINYQPTQDNLAARKWFEDSRFGLFVHWGVYSVLGDGEWVMNQQKLSIDEYEKLPSFFNPIDFNPKDWVKMVKDAGMKYITITSRHHDGFSMFKTYQNEYNIVDSTPYGKDVLKMLADECHKQGIKIFFYYSTLDWHNDDYFPRGRTGNDIEGRGEGDWNNYISFMKAQLTELLTNYGPIGGIWFDGHWDQKEWDPVTKKYGKDMVDWHYEDIYKLIHSIQPACLIGNNHHLAPIPGEDFQMFERDLPGQNTTGWGSSKEDIGDLPKEICETINGSWGFNLRDRKHKSSKELIHYLVKAAGYGSNLLLNVGPMPNGKIQPTHIKSLMELGNWLKLYGETIYETRQGPLNPNVNYVSTQKKNKVYIHFLNSEQTNYEFNGIKNSAIKSIKYFNSNLDVEYSHSNDILTINLNKDIIDEIDTIITISL